MASLAFPAAIGHTEDIHSTQQNEIGQSAFDTQGRIWVYLKGVASCVEGSFVTYDEAGVTTLLATGAKGPVAIAGAAIVDTKFGWFCVFAPNGVSGMIAANTADNTLIGFETTAGHAGDGRAAGDEIYNAVVRGSTAGAAALTTVQIMFPHVDDVNGA